MDVSILHLMYLQYVLFLSFYTSCMLYKLLLILVCLIVLVLFLSCINECWCGIKYGMVDKYYGGVGCIMFEVVDNLVWYIYKKNSAEILVK